MYYSMIRKSERKEKETDFVIYRGKNLSIMECYSNLINQLMLTSVDYFIQLLSRADKSILSFGIQLSYIITNPKGQLIE